MAATKEHEGNERVEVARRSTPEANLLSAYEDALKDFLRTVKADGLCGETLGIVMTGLKSAVSYSQFLRHPEQHAAPRLEELFLQAGGDGACGLDVSKCQLLVKGCLEVQVDWCENCRNDASGHPNIKPIGAMKELFAAMAAQFESIGAQVHAYMDADRDGFVSRLEFKQMWVSMSVELLSNPGVCNLYDVMFANEDLIAAATAGDDEKLMVHNAVV